MVTMAQTVLINAASVALSFDWVLQIFNDPQRMIQIGAVIVVVAIFLLSKK